MERNGRRTSRPLRLGPGSVPTRDQVTMPAQHRVRAYQQPQPTQHLRPHTVDQRRQDRPVGQGEPHLLPTQLTFQHGDMMPQRQDFDVLVPIAHRKKTQHRERVRHRQVRQSQQHSRPSCRGGHLPRRRSEVTNHHHARTQRSTSTPLTCMDEVFGRHTVERQRTSSGSRFPVGRSSLPGRRCARARSGAPTQMGAACAALLDVALGPQHRSSRLASPLAIRVYGPFRRSMTPRPVRACP